MRKLIITQDIRSLLDQGENFLNRSDVRIFPAVSNEEALDIHRAEKADVIIASLDAHTLSGEQLCSTIRENRELCRVSLIILHSGENAHIQRLTACRANAFIERSADPALIIETARQLISVPVREAYRTAIGIKVNCGSGLQATVGFAENISVTGMLFDSESLFSKGEILSCWFVLPDSTHVRTTAEVVRISDRATEHDSNRYGIRFIDLDPAYKAAIDAYVRKRQQRP
ncbi:MAG: PilZ domain-containing protein [Thermodesulfovibrionales bacterium]